MAYKIKSSGNYIIVEDLSSKKVYSAGKANTRFTKKEITDLVYDYFIDGVYKISIRLSDMVDQYGIPFTDIEFNAWRFRNTGESQDVFIQDQITPVLDQYLGIELNSISLTVAATVNDSVINVTAGHGIVAGNFIEMYEGPYFSQTEVQSVSVNAITLSMPVDQPFTTGAAIKVISVELNVDGSISDKISWFKPSGTNSYDIVRAVLVMTHGTAGDDGKFGNLVALNKGLYFRKTNGNFKNLFNAKSNGELRIRAFDLEYSDRAGGQGTYSTSSRRTFGGQSKNGVTVRINSTSHDSVQAVIRDNLTGLTTFRILIQGHVVD